MLGGAKNWGYQLRLIDFAQVAASPLDLIVIDHAVSAERRFVRQFTRDEIAAVKRKPDDRHRIVLAYMSIGEAERYRFYWDQAWYRPDGKPSWLGAMNPEWDGNYRVRFWDPRWQALILEGEESYLGRIRAAGFDGIYLDRADVFQELLPEKPDAEREIVAFLCRIADAARRDDPHFVVVMQNAEELLRHRTVIGAIDAIAKEDLYYGINHDQKPNAPGTVLSTLKDLEIARRHGRRVLVVEYLSDAKTIARARRRSEAAGFLFHATTRDLGVLSLSPSDDR